MDLSVMDQETSREVYLGEDTPEQLHPSYHRDGCQDSLSSYSNGSIISQLLQRTIQNQRALKDSLFFSTPPALSSSCMADHLEDRRSSSSKESGGGPSSPDSQPSTAASPEGERPLNEHQRAKRARVENIIRGMAASPSAWPPQEWERSDGYVRESQEGRREKRRKQAVAEPQERRPRGSRDEEYQSLRQQLQVMQALLGKLQEKFIQVHGLSESVHEVGEGKGPTGLAECRADSLQDKGHAERPERKLPVDPDSEFEQRMYRVKVGRRKTEQTDSVRLTLDYEDRSLPETLKDELSKAVSQSVDLVFQNFSSASFNHLPQLHLGLKDRTEDRNAVPGARGLPVAADAVRSWPMECYKTTEAQPNGGDQTEALSLVIRKPPPRQAGQVEMLRKPCQVRPYPFPLGHGKALQENQILEHLLKYGPQEDYGSLPGIPLPGDRSGPDLVDFPWHSVKVRSKVKPSGDAEPAATASHAVVLGQVAMDSLCFPHVKMERGNLQSMVERTPYMSLNEGLTPNHLKKAKLMFFFTRYPSSNALKTFFPDVKFNRCVTSQLIKWFSNFREFYYIQVEKFARQAIMDGVANAKDLSVTRDSELFRALNMHYNKANDFQVPDRFLDVAETTLGEFFNAILLAKDSDPSWKKAIYKVICKLDSDVPDDFKSFACS